MPPFLTVENLDQPTLDLLTTCPTTRLVTRAAAEVIAARRPAGESWGCVFVDVDRLKPVNDECGHEAGDHLLALVAAIVRANVRDNDQIVCRWGGDEVVVLTPGCADAAPIGRRIAQALDGRFHAIASVGWACAAGIAAAVAEADWRMYETKSAARRNQETTRP